MSGKEQLIELRKHGGRPNTDPVDSLFPAKKQTNIKNVYGPQIKFFGSFFKSKIFWFWPEDIVVFLLNEIKKERNRTQWIRRFSGIFNSVQLLFDSHHTT